MEIEYFGMNSLTNFFTKLKKLFATKTEVANSYETKTDSSAKLDEAKAYADTLASGKADIGHIHDAATIYTDGFMSATDKVQLSDLTDKVNDLETEISDLSELHVNDANNLTSAIENMKTELSAEIDAERTMTHVAGTLAVVEDSAEDSLLNTRVFGKTEQFTTTGAQLATRVYDGLVITNMGLTLTITNDWCIANGTPTTRYANGLNESLNLEPGTYHVSGGEIKAGCVFAQISKTKSDGTTEYYINSSFVVDGTEQSIVLTIQTNDPALTTISNYKFYPMLNKGSSPLPWEPFTGSMPAPNPDYPQELVNVGTNGEIGVSVAGKNLLNIVCDSNTYNGITVTKRTDGGFDASGTATATSVIAVGYFVAHPGIKYKFSGCPAGGSLTTWHMAIRSEYQNILYGDDTGNGFEYTFTELTKVYYFIRVASGQTVNQTFYPMVRVASIEDDTFKPSTLVSLPVSTPAGLPGIPVADASLANYTDADGKMWCCDEVDLERGKYVKRVGSTVLNGTESWSKHSVAVGGGNQYFYSFNGGQKAFADGTHGNFSHFRTGGLGSSDGNGFVGANTIQVRLDSVSSAADLKTWFGSNHTTVQFILATPVETDLTKAQIEAYRAILTKNPTTTIFTDAGAYFEADVVRESETSRHIETIAERSIAKFNEATSGIDSKTNKKDGINSYNNLGSIYFGGSPKSYTKINLPEAIKEIWTMLFIELSFRQDYSSNSYGKLFINAYHNGTSPYTWNMKAVTTGNLMNTIAVYGGEGNCIYVTGYSGYGGMSIDKILVGDTAGGADFTTTTIENVDSLPETYQTATMVNTLTTANALEYLGITSTATELNYVDGVTSNIQDQIDAIDWFSPGASIPAASDLNNYTTPGKYYVSNTATAATITNTPTTSNNYVLYVFARATSASITQLAICYSGNIYVRGTNSSGTWRDWKKPAYDGHTHTTSDITSGTLSSGRLPTVPIAKGGTGATTAATALTNLGITAGTSDLTAGSSSLTTGAIYQVYS